MRSGFLSLVLPAVFSGCQILSAPDGSRIHLVVEDTTFSIDEGGRGYAVPWIVENQGTEPVHLSRCGDSLLFEVERWENNTWVNAKAAVCITIYTMTPLPLAPGQALQGLQQISTPGHYRLRLGVSEHADGKRSSVVTSETFTIQ
jgi:hypothetical protein